MDLAGLANILFFLVPEVLVCLVGGLLIVVFGKEFMENRRALNIGKNGAPASPYYWGRYQQGSDEKDSIVQIASREQN